MNKWMIILVAVLVLLFVGLAIKVFAGRGFDPEYEANRQLRTALNGEIFTGDEEKDQIEIERLMKLPRFSKTFPTGELAKTNWVYVDPGLEYAVEHDWTDSVTSMGTVIFNRIEKRKKK